MAKMQGPAPQQKIEGADKVLRSALIKTDSGNTAICTPAINGTRAVVYMKWSQPPSDSEVKEVWALLETMGMPKVDEVRSASSAAEVTKFATDYLKRGKQ